MEKIAKTRIDSTLGLRSKPHLYLPCATSTMFLWVTPTPFGLAESIKASDDLISFEMRINWSTWGPSRVAR